MIIEDILKERGITIKVKEDKVFVIKKPTKRGFTKFMPFSMLTNYYKRINRDAREQYHKAISSGVNADYIMDSKINPSFTWKNGTLTFTAEKKKAS